MLHPIILLYIKWGLYIALTTLITMAMIILKYL